MRKLRGVRDPQSNVLHAKVHDFLFRKKGFFLCRYNFFDIIFVDIFFVDIIFFDMLFFDMFFFDKIFFADTILRSIFPILLNDVPCILRGASSCLSDEVHPDNRS